MTGTPLSPGQAAALLAELAGPRGPMATDEQADRPRRQLLHGPPAAAARVILAAVAGRPALPPAIPVTWDDVNHEAADLLSELAGEPDVPPLLTAALGDPATRPVALEALALAADPATAPALA